MDRLCRTIEGLGDRDVGEITEAIVDAVGRWQVRQWDDIAVLVARHLPQ
jgi:hypothetical protein